MTYASSLMLLAGVFLVSCISPGPDFLAITAMALRRRQAGVGMALGVAVSHGMWAAMAIFGLGAVVAETPLIGSVLRWAGAAYLSWLGASVLWAAFQARKVQPPSGQGQESQVPSHPDHRLWWQALLRGLLLGLGNPKAAVFFASLFLSLVPVAAPLTIQLAVVGIVVSVSAGWFVGLAMMFSHPRFRQLYQRARRPVDAVVGLMLLGLGVRLVF